MSAPGALLRTVVFGESPPGAWGAVFSLQGSSFAALGDGSSAVAGSAAVVGDDPELAWTLSGDDFDLTVESVPDLAVVGPDGFDQLCTVRGRHRERELRCPGYRSARTWEQELGDLDSLRAVAMVFDNDYGIGLIASRPRRAKGHSADSVSAAVLEPEGPAPVQDPRLTTTYSGDGRPVRAALELWIGDQQGEQRLRRAAGEALGPQARGALAELAASCGLFAWHSRGVDGIGVYLLVRGE